MTPYIRRVGFRVLAAFFFFATLLAATAAAQVTTGNITGRVADAQGNVVPGAAVTARSKATGRSRATTTNEAGEYTLADLPAGTYELSVEAKGFSKAVLGEMELNVGATVTQNFDLKPGELSETVQVSSEAALVQTTTSELGRSITPVEVRELPLINRTFASLSIVAPEARAPSATSTRPRRASATSASTAATAASST